MNLTLTEFILSQVIPVYDKNQSCGNHLECGDCCPLSFFVMQMRYQVINTLKQLCDYEIKLISGYGCGCFCVHPKEEAFIVDCVPSIDYCEYLCKEILFSTLEVGKCSEKCDAIDFHGRYPKAYYWVENKNENQEL